MISENRTNPTSLFIEGRGFKKSKMASSNIRFLRLFFSFLINFLFSFFSQKSLNQANHEKATLEKKVTILSSKLSSALSQLQDEKEISRALQRNQTAWQTKFNNLESQFKGFQETKDKELLDLKEQLRDVMFFLEAQKQIEASDAKEEIAEGRIVVGEPAPQPGSSNVGKHRRKKHR